MKKIILATLCIIGILSTINVSVVENAMSIKPEITSISPANNLN